LKKIIVVSKKHKGLSTL